jgi:8-oxo-dGTP pyrophosphatase MutT (NUDIX family)
VIRLAVEPAWRDRLLAAADAPPVRPRVPLSWETQRIGSVEPDLFARAGLAGGAAVVPAPDGGWRVAGELSASLRHVAEVLRDTGLAHAWRDEQLAVAGEEGTVLGTVERAAVRPLGIATQAVHLSAVTSDGRLWLQQRAFDKPTDPGRWDTLVGGMVPAEDNREQALERETWEEAGLRLAQVRGLHYGGRILTRRPFPDLPHGFIVELLDWFTCTLPDDVVPANQDGEVAGFHCMDPGEVVRLLHADACTVDAALVLLAAHGG